MLRYALTNLRANLTRLVATALAVIIGIGFLAAGLMLTDAMRDALTGSVARQYADVDLVVEPAAAMEGAPTALPIETLDEVRSTSGVDGAAGQLSGPVHLLSADDESLTSRSQGRAWIDVERLNPLTVEDGDAPAEAAVDASSGEEVQVVVDRGTASENDLEVGSSVRLATPAGPTEATVVGITSFDGQDAIDDGGTFSFAPRTAMSLLAPQNPGWSDIIVATDAGQAESVRQTLASSLPTTAEVVTGEAFRATQQAQNAGLVDLLRPALQGFAYLALFVAAFVIFNTFSVVVTQRFRELALIRAVGGTPAQVRRSLMLEGLLIGLVSSMLGIIGGLALTYGVQTVLDRFDLGLPQGSINLSAGTVAVCMLVGTIVTVLSVIVPAFRAGRTKPVEAMRDSAVDTSGTSTVRAVLGAVFLGLALLLLALNQFTDPKWYYLAPGGFLLFISLFVAGPLLARGFALAVTPVLARFGMTGRLAADNSVRNPRRTATTANALVIGLFLVTLVTVSGEAMKAYLVGELNKLSSSDYVLAAERSLDDQLIADIRGIDGVAGVAPLRFGQVSSSMGPLVITATDDPTSLGEVAGMTLEEGSFESVLDGDGIAVAQMGELGGAGPQLDLGDQVSVTDAAGAERTLTVAAVLADGGINSLIVSNLVSEKTLTELSGDQPVAMAFIRAEPGQAEDVGRRIEQAFDGYTGVELMAGNFVGDIIGTIFDFLIGAVNALLGMSVVVALVGIVNTMTLAIFERRRELGMVRALGMTRQQVGRTIRLEAVLIGLLGTLVGIGAGVLLSWVVVSSIPEVEIGLSFNWARVGLIFLVGVLVGVLASLVPARRATRLDMLEAMRSE